MPRRCCLGCTPTRGVLHIFPNPDKFPEQFKAWVRVVSGQDECNFNYKIMRICDRHFTEKDRNRYNRLNALAVPSLFLCERPSNPCGLSKSTSEQTFNQPEVSDNYHQSSSGKIYEKAMEKAVPWKQSSLENPEISDIQQSTSERPSNPCGLSNSTSEQTFNQPEVSDNYHQSSSGKIYEKAMEKAVPWKQSSLENPEISDIQQSTSGASQEVPHNPQLEHNYCKPLATTYNARSWKKKKLSSVTSKKCIIYQRNVRNLRRQMCRLRKRGEGLKLRLENAEKLFNKSYFLKVVKDMTPAAKIFTNMQYFQVGKKPAGRRFSIEEKVLSLSLYKRSPKCYGLMSKYFVLPSTKSLKRLLAQIKLSPGINKTIFDKLKKTVSNLDTEDRLCTLIFDEMSIMPQIQYDSSYDELKGFTSHGKSQIANHALVFMVKGIKKHYKQPVAYFFTNALNKIELKSIIKDVIKNIQETGLIVLCTVCDQSTVNVSAIEGLIKETKEKYFKKGKEMPLDFFEINKKKIIPLYDVPHLLKGLRNNLLNKTMSYIDYEDENKIKSIKWEYFQQLYAADKSCGELSCLQKLTEEHVVPEKIKKMRVKNAVQIFSHSVAVITDHLTARGMLPVECRSTIPITLLLDDLFDTLNCNTFEIPNGKIYKGPVRRNSPHHQLWLKAKKYLKSIKFQSSKKVGNKIRKFETVVPSSTNFVKTIEGIQELWKILSQKYSFDSMLTRNFNQDPVENFFGSIRNCGARNIAPNVMAFEGAFKTILLNNLNAHSAQANCEEDSNSFLQSFHFFTENAYTVSNTDVSEEKEINLREEVLKDVKLPKDLGQRNYVCGWILRKCLKNVIKNCKTCRKTVSCRKNNTNSYIAAKEYFPDKKLLCYPSKQLEECFHNIQSICVSHLKSDVLKTGIKKEIKTVTEIFVQFPFKCETHKEKLKEYFTDLTINILIYSWCKSVNRILAGKLTYFDGEDETKMYAQNYYNKHRHNINK